MTYCSAGQAPLLLLREDTDEVEIIGADGIPVGILDELENLSSKIITMRPGDIFAVLTDGFYEWFRSDKQMFGFERVCEVIRKNRSKDADSILRAIREALAEFVDTKQDDDLTAIMIKKQ